MSGSQALIYIINTLGQLYLLLVLLRFVLQLVRADFYNPLSQFIVKATQPLLMPIRRIVPGFGGIDFAALVLALLVHMALSAAILLIAGASSAELLSLLPLLAVWCLISLASLFVKIFFFALIISVILSWVAQGSRHPAVALVHQVCEPALAPIRRILPSMGGIDISPIFAFLALNLLDGFVIANLAQMAHMPAIISPFM